MEKMDTEIVDALKTNGWNASEASSSEWVKDNAVFDTILDTVKSLTTGCVIDFSKEDAGTIARISWAEHIAKESITA
jgi:hypothetical protein